MALAWVLAIVNLAVFRIPAVDCAVRFPVFDQLLFASVAPMAVLAVVVAIGFLGYAGPLPQTHMLALPPTATAKVRVRGFRAWLERGWLHYFGFGFSFGGLPASFEHGACSSGALQNFPKRHAVPGRRPISMCSVTPTRRRALFFCLYRHRHCMSGFWYTTG
jgi:hypothetical protein